MYPLTHLCYLPCFALCVDIYKRTESALIAQLIELQPKTLMIVGSKAQFYIIASGSILAKCLGIYINFALAYTYKYIVNFLQFLPLEMCESGTYFIMLTSSDIQSHID